MADREETDRWFGDPRYAGEPEKNRPRDHCPSCGFPVAGLSKDAACPNCGSPLEREEAGDAQEGDQ